MIFMMIIIIISSDEMKWKLIFTHMLAAGAAAHLIRTYAMDRWKNDN